MVADEATLAAALDAQLPGQGRADELWLQTRDPGAVRALAARGGLSASFRSTIDARLRSAPVAHAMLGTLVGGGIAYAVLAVVGLLVVVLGRDRDRVNGTSSNRGLARARSAASCCCGRRSRRCAGCYAGFALAALLTRLAVAAVASAGSGATAQPPLVTVVPWGQLVLSSIAAAGALIVISAVAARSTRWTP